MGFGCSIVDRRSSATQKSMRWLLPKVEGIDIATAEALHSRELGKLSYSLPMSMVRTVVGDGTTRRLKVEHQKS